MSLITPGEVQATVASGLSSEQMQALIDREETELIRRFGDHSITAGSATILTETIPGWQSNVFVDRRIATVASITESNDGFASVSALTPVTGYHLFAEEGRIERVGGKWAKDVRIVYTATDDDDVRKSCLIELVRIAVERQAFAREAVAGEYSYVAPDNWEQTRESIYGRLKPFVIVAS